MDRTKTGHCHVRNKVRFVEAADPNRVLGEFFDALGPKVACRSSTILEEPRLRSVPLILISQLPRSGGSLFSQLLDGHPQLMAYPYEMRIGYPSKCTWPRLDPCESPGRLFTMLFQTEFGQFAAHGYRKPGKVGEKPPALRFHYSPQEHYRAFIRLLNARREREAFRAKYFGRLLPCSLNSRTVLDCYFGAFFHAWPAGRAPAPRYVSGFLPGLAEKPRNVVAFFADYPDGRLVTIMRNPADWFVSRRAHTRDGVARYDDLEREMAVWNRMAGNTLRYRRDYGDRFLLLSFRDLVTDREGTMRRLAAWCGIDFDPALLRQTFAGNRIGPNTNFHDSPERRPEAVLERSTCLSDHERRLALALTTSSRGQLRELGVDVDTHGSQIDSCAKVA
jgi:hypothetical protein